MQTITPWGEKYRPRKLKDIVHQSDIVKILKQNINHGIPEFMKRLNGGYTNYFNFRTKTSPGFCRS